MSFNPYAPPQAGIPPLGPLPPMPPGGGMRQRWETGEVLKLAWEIFKNNGGALVGAVLVMGVIMVAPAIGLVAFAINARGVMDPEAIRKATIPLTVVYLFVTPFFQAGIMRLWLAAARGQQPSVGMLFSGGDRYGAMLWKGFLFQVPVLLCSAASLVAAEMGSLGLIAAAGGLQQIATLVILVLQMLGLFYADFFIVDQRLGAIDAIKQSWSVAGWERGPLFIFGLVGGLIIIASACCCGFPMLIAYPVVMVGAAIVYLRMTGQAPEWTPQQGM